MTKIRAIFGSLLFLLIAPGTVAGLLPWVLSQWVIEPPFFGLAALKWIGVALLVDGTIVLLESFARFALQGEGTPAPPFPTKRLVVSGFYRYVRNPMYVGVLALIIGQAFLFGNGTVLAYGGLITLAFHLFVRGYEEPTMRKTYPEDYVTYCAHVRRWWPRLTPWTP